MAIDPRIVTPPVSTTQGIAVTVADLSRRLRVLEAVRSTIGSGIDGGAITPGTIPGSAIVTGSITAELIQAGAINAGHIAANSIETIHLVAGSVTSEKIAAGTITAGNIAAGTITAAQIAAFTITANELAANSVTAGKIAAGAVTALNIDVSTLSAISTDMGNLSAGTITGATFQTDVAGSRIVVNSTGLKGYASDGTTINIEFNTGSGILTAKGIIIADPGSQLPVATIIGDFSGGNKLYNSSFQDVTNPLSATWNLYNNALSPAAVLDVFTTTLARDGDKVARITNSTDTTGQMGVVTATAKRPQVTVGSEYTLSCYIQPVGTSTNFKCHIHWINSSGTIIGSGTQGALTPAPADVWSRAKVTGTAPAGAVRAHCYCWVDSPGSGLVVYFDSAQFEEGETVTSYAPRVDEILPDTIAGPELQAGSVTTNKMTAGTINGDRITANTLNANRIIAGTITALQIATGAITADVIAAGAIQAQHLSIASPVSGYVRNGTFASGLAATSTVTPGDLILFEPGFIMDDTAILTDEVSIYEDLLLDDPGFLIDDNAVLGMEGQGGGGGGPVVISDYTWPDWNEYGPSGAGSWAVVSDATFGSIAQVQNTSSGNTYRGQHVTLPKGRNVLRAWVRTIGVAGASGAQFGASIFSGIATITNPAAVTGSTEWALKEIVVDVPAAPATVNLYMQLGATSTGTAQFANIHSLASVTTTEIGPGTITTGHITTNSLSGTVIQAGTLDASKITALSITSSMIAANSITADKINFRFAGLNLEPNSSFESGVTAITGTNATMAETTAARTGVKALQVTSTVSGNITARHATPVDLITGTVGEPYTFTGYVKAPSAARVASIAPRFYDAAGTTFLAGTPTGTSPTVIDETITTSANWQRVRLTFPFTPGSNGVPSAAVKMGWEITFAATGVGQVFHVDDIQIERGDAPSEWSQHINPTVIDGSTITAPVIQTSLLNPKLRLDAASGLYLTDSAGEIVSQFRAGAGGLDLTTSVFASPEDSRRIRFISHQPTTDEIPMGSIYHSESVNEGLNVLAEHPTSRADVKVRANGGTGPEAGLRVSSRSGSFSDDAFVDVTVNGNSERILDRNGYSDFAWGKDYYYCSGNTPNTSTSALIESVFTPVIDTGSNATSPVVRYFVPTTGVYRIDGWIQAFNSNTGTIVNLFAWRNGASLGLLATLTVPGTAIAPAAGGFILASLTRGQLISIATNHTDAGASRTYPVRWSIVPINVANRVG